MPKPLLPRELCRYRVALDEFIIQECQLDAQVARDFCREPMHKCDHEPDEDVVQWAAYRVEGETIKDLIAYGWIAPCFVASMLAQRPGGALQEAYEVGVVVHWEFRNQGLGTIMFQQAQDLAKKHKIAELWTVVPPGKSVGHLERDGFDFKEQADGTKVGRMEVR